MKTQLVQTITSDDLILSALYNEGSQENAAVVLIHGFLSDFYTHKFVQDIQLSLTSKNIASISIQTRGTGIRTEIVKRGRNDSEWIGSFYEKIDEAHLDIDAWIELLKEKGYKKIVLAGHSLGTIKAVRFMFEGKNVDLISKLILLAPFDKNGYIENLTKGKWKEYVNISNEKVFEGKGKEIILKGYDDFPMSYQNYASWYEDSELSNIWDFYKNEKYDCSVLKKIHIPVQVIVGDKDDFLYIPEFSTLESTKKILIDNIQNLDLNIIEGSGHTYVGYEHEVIRLINNFIQ